MSGSLDLIFGSTAEKSCDPTVTSSYNPLWVYPAAWILARMSFLTMPLLGSPTSHPIKPTVLALGDVFFRYWNSPGSGSFGVMARVPQKYGIFWAKMLVPPPPSMVNILY